jgi:hypothetical protein
MAVIEHEVMTERAAELDEAGRILLGAAAIVRERWRQGDYGRDGGPRCLVGAIAEAGEFHGGGLYDKFAVVERSPIYKRLVDSLGILGSTVVNWNDQEGRTAEEVAEALERAAYGV